MTHGDSSLKIKKSFSEKNKIKKNPPPCPQPKNFFVTLNKTCFFWPYSIVYIVLIESLLAYRALQKLYFGGCCM